MGQQSATDVLLDLIQNAKHGIGGDLRLVEVHIVSCPDDLRHHSTGGEFGEGLLARGPEGLDFRITQFLSFGEACIVPENLEWNIRPHGDSVDFLCAYRTIPRWLELRSVSVCV